MAMLGNYRIPFIKAPGFHFDHVDLASGLSNRNDRIPFIMTRRFHFNSVNFARGHGNVGHTMFRLGCKELAMPYAIFVMFWQFYASGFSLDNTCIPLTPENPSKVMNLCKCLNYVIHI